MSIELSLTTVSIDTFLYPVDVSNVESGEAALNPKQKVQARVHLSVPEKADGRVINSFTVTLESKESLGFPRGGYETTELFSVTEPVPGTEGMRLKGGTVYHWEVVFWIANEEAPYERSVYGRVRQLLTAKLSFAGFFSKTLVAEKNAFFIACPGGDSFLSFSRTHRSAAEGLGPIFAHAQSENFTVGGYTRFALALPSPSPTLILHGLTLAIVQQILLIGRSDPDRIERCAPQRLVFLEIDKESIHTSPPPSFPSYIDKQIREEMQSHSSQGFENSWVARLPNDHQARPSYIPGSRASIRISHFLEYTIAFSDGDETVKHHRAAWPVVLPSCAARFHSFKLPGYSALDASPVPEQDRETWSGPNQHESHSQCSCGETLEKLLTYEDEVDDSVPHRPWTTQQMMTELRNVSGTSSPARSRRTSVSRDRERARGDEIETYDRSRSRGRSREREREPQEDEDTRREREDRERAKRDNQYVSVEEWTG